MSDPTEPELLRKARAFTEKMEAVAQELELETEDLSAILAGFIVGKARHDGLSREQFLAFVAHGWDEIERYHAAVS